MKLEYDYERAVQLEHFAQVWLQLKFAFITGQKHCFAND